VDQGVTNVLLPVQPMKMFTIVPLLLLAFLLAAGPSVSPFPPVAASKPAVASAGKPLIIYYSRLGTTRTIAREMAQNLKCEIEEIISNENRHGLWTVNCVFDQLLDWDDDVVPLYHDVTAYNPVIIAGPLWIHRFATPLRTVLQSLDLQQKDVYVLVTHQGNYSEKDANNARNSLKERGAAIRGYASIMTRDKKEKDLKQETRRVLEDLYNIFPHLTPPAIRR
jgi:flavodoxin